MHEAQLINKECICKLSDCNIPIMHNVKYACATFINEFSTTANQNCIQLSNLSCFRLDVASFTVHLAMLEDI